MNSEAVRVLFFDIDGTTYQHNIHDNPASTKKALQALKRRGYRLAICTSRTLDETVALPTDFLSCMDGMITGGGAVIYDQGKAVAVTEIDEQDTKAAIAYLDEKKIVYRWNTADGECHLNTDSPEHSDIFYYLYLMRPSVQKWEGQRLINLLLYFHNDQEVEDLRRLLPNSFVLQLQRACEITGQGINKEAAMLQLAKHWGFDQSATAAFGDGFNDVGMLQTAQIGIAMGNGCEPAKEAADYITAPIEEDGLAKACLHFGWITEDDLC